MSPKLAQGRHDQARLPCPLSGVKRTLQVYLAMSANDPKRTFRLAADLGPKGSWQLYG